MENSTKERDTLIIVTCILAVLLIAAWARIEAAETHCGYQDAITYVCEDD